MSHQEPALPADQRRAQIGVLQQYAIVAVIGVLLVGAGYFPVVTVYLPGLNGIDSRINATAVFGASVAIGALLMLAANAVTSNRRSAGTFFLGACLPLVVWGTYVQSAVALDNARSWQEQKQIWNALLGAVPNLKDGSRVVILLRGFENRFGFGAWQRPPLAAWWDVTGGVRLLYDNRTLEADVVYLDADVPHGTKLAPDGVYNAQCAETVPYDQVVAALYDPLTGTMRVLDKFPPWLVAESAATNLDAVRFCPDCVLSSGLADVEFRSLVQ
jgi:hypothetical protein